MEDNHNPQKNFESLKHLLLMIAQERSIDRLLEMLVQGLAEIPHIALARLWLALPGDLCHQCLLKAECPDQSECLHLVASRGKSLVDTDESWGGKNGDFRRFPIGIRKVGMIAAAKEPIIIKEIQPDSEWLVRPQWVEDEKIVGFAGQPLLFRDEALGVLMVFSRIHTTEEELIWLRMLADHAAAAIMNARAFEEIETLRKQLEYENDYLKQEVNEAHAFGEIIGRSEALKKNLEQINLVAETNANVLIYGESGTGKELVAREIHHRSQRCNKPLIKVNCASVPKELYESEFFGHVKGSFTGAVRDRLGRFQAADGGTLFLDEIGEIPIELQSKLLRVLQEGEFERVGEDKSRKVNVRIIAATNRNLKEEVEAGRFRHDLYYRLNVFPIDVAPLRDRKEDIPLLVGRFIQEIRHQSGRSCGMFSPAQMIQLQHYDWPGNIRELQNVIERAVIISQSGQLQLDIPPTIQSSLTVEPSKGTVRLDDGKLLTDDEFKQLEKENIINALIRTKWKIYGEDGAANLLGLKPTTLSSKIKKYQIAKSTDGT
ncbi:MAG: sigma 54-interacting transcriptional regulator [Candidatus Hinthialibacter antarcticus]|nr:sigma 54-interacting transcriptional regulator [Candidatus Hinthialibacter antarcticus]